MYASDTIVAVASPPGAGGIGIVRLSGPRAAAIAAALFRPRHAGGRPQSHRLYPGIVVGDDGAPLDEVLCVHMHGPHSYTGEDVVELHCHGSPILLRRVIESCCAAGARIAEPGEFTKRAFINGKVDLIQAESVGEIIHARTEAAARIGLRHLSGSLSLALNGLRDALIDVKAHVEVLIDFAEEDVDLTPQALLGGLERADAAISALIQSYRVGRLLRDGFQLAIVGRPNVGKSSLLNALLGSERAIVTPIPGTTRDVIEESVDIGGVPVVLADTAGLRDDADAVERIGIERARAVAAHADGVLLVLDRSVPLTAADRVAMNSVAQLPGVIVLNKSDLPGMVDAEAIGAMSARALVEVSALRGDGIESLRAAIAALFCTEASDAGAPQLTLVRHRDALVKALESVRLARDGLAHGAPVDVVAVDIQSAVDHIGGITGIISTDDVLDRIFRDFCIGK